MDRLLGLVDLVVWVLDPQKYADNLVHKEYLARLRHYREVTVVVLNQADLLAPADARRCVLDLHRLLDADGLGGVPVFATSAVAPAGLDELRTLLERTVAARRAVLDRLDSDRSVPDHVLAFAAPRHNFLPRYSRLPAEQPTPEFRWPLTPVTT